MIKFIYGVIPVPVTFTDNMAKNTAGYARGPVVRLRPRYENDRGLLEHELEHVRQFWRMVFSGVLLSALFVLMAVLFDDQGWFASAILVPFIGLLGHNFLYSRFAAYRLWSEVTCYRIQARWYPDDRRPLFAEFIAYEYGLDITPQDALRRLNDA